MGETSIVQKADLWDNTSEQIHSTCKSIDSILFEQIHHHHLQYSIAQLLLFLTYVLCFILHLPYPGLLTLLPCFIYLFTLISDAPFLKWHCISLDINLSHVARHLAQYTSQNGFTHILVISFWLQYIFLHFSDLQCPDMFEFPFKVLPHLSQVHSCFDSLLQLT